MPEKSSCSYTLYSIFYATSFGVGGWGDRERNERRGWTGEKEGGEARERGKQQRSGFKIKAGIVLYVRTVSGEGRRGEGAIRGVGGRNKLTQIKIWEIACVKKTAK